jgi:ComF family protein
MAFSCCLYEGILIDLIHSFKYHGMTSLRKTFVDLMIQSTYDHHIPLDDFDMIVPIPLHPTKFRERGYNQAELLSFALSEHWQIQHRKDVLIRVTHRPSQTSLQAKQRWTNTQGAFKISSSLDIADKSILIIDDLLTTAATANEAAKSLKEAGAASVGVISLAITP